MAGGSFWDSFLGAGSLFEQLFLWQIVGQVVTTATQPMMDSYSQKVYARSPVAVLQPPDLADAVVRSYMDQPAAAAEAARSGLNAERFNLLVPLHQDAPGPQELASGLLRGLIPDQGSGAAAVSFEQGIREGRLGNKWIPLIRGLADQLLSPADAASAVVRHFMPPEAGTAEAAKSGVDAERFQTMVDLSGDAPGPQQLAEALRRGIIPQAGTGAASTSFQQGIAEGRLADKWAPVIQQLAPEWPSPADALRAALTGQVPQDQAAALYERWGGDPQWFQIMFDTEGSAPTPLEAVEMALRGIIPWTGTGPDVTSYDQAFLEGPWRNKWKDAYQKAAYPVPTSGELTEFLRYGIIDSPAAAAELAKRGITGDYATWVLDYAEAVSTYDFRGLTMTSVMNALSASIITEANAVQILQSMHMSPQAVNLLVQYTQVQKAIGQVNTAITHVGSLYIAHKITPDTARAALSQLGLDAQAQKDIIQTWDLEAVVSVVTLTESQIIDAWYYGIFTIDQALSELTNIGYTPFDAWALISIKGKGPQGAPPAPGPPPSLGVVIPGTT